MAGFGNDAFRWYNVGDWAELGLAVPHFSNDRKSQNDTVRYLVEAVGRNTQAVMFHTDALLRTPPSINTLERIHKLCTRVRSILSSRAVPSGVNNMESAHAVPAPEDHLVFPTPYFKVRNPWLKQYCGLSLLSLTEMYQHQENAKPLEISTDFANLAGQYFQRIYRLIAVELLRVPLAEVTDPEFTLTDEMLRSYNPGQWFTSTEMIDTVPDMSRMPTEDDLEPLTNGIPTSLLPELPRWPTSTYHAGGGGAGSATPARSGESFRL
ncbi:MAG: hypothetical protein KF774_17840 [Planctomyces sp.]|nr:hypothetical protein [Planctomyces sp.]